MSRPRVSRAMQAAVWVRQFGDLTSPGQCPYCKNKIAQIGCEFDHIIPLARGGAHIAPNLQAVCAVCNRSKNDRSSKQMEQELGRLQMTSDMIKPRKRNGKLCAAITKS